MRRLIAALVLCGLVACDGGRIAPRPRPSVTSAASPSPVSTSTASAPSSSAHQLPAITLIADLSAPPTRWKPVAFIPFGERTAQLGALLKKKFASVPIVPPSFAVGRDGSIWFLDLVKRRIAHYSGAGSFLGDVPGLDFDRFDPYGQDIGFAGGRLHLLEFVHNTIETNLREVGQRIGPRRRIRTGSEELVMIALASPQDSVIGRVIGSAGTNGQPPTGRGEIGDFRVDPSTGHARRVPGFRLDDGTWMQLGLELISEGQEIEIHQVTRGARIARHIRLRVAPNLDSPRRIPSVVAWKAYCALPHGMATYVQLSPSRTADQDRYGGGQWLFEYFDDGQPIVWERLPDSPLDAAEIYRHLAEGLDGHLYLMLAERGGMRIYRRPGPPAR
ncbi:MAG: hypothetical protein ACJ77A_18090 [Actinomycetota bacterium]